MKWSKDNPERAKKSNRDRKILWKYGLTSEAYAKLLEEQLGMCGICCCLIDSKKVHTNFAVDHCHVTGEVRGLLCNQCNRALGMLEDSENVVRAALQYLMNFKEKMRDTH